jgi:hypothetical protein
MSKITEQISAGVYELVQSKLLATLQADEVLAAVIESFSTELPDENTQFGGHQVPRIICITERRDEEIDSDGQARIDHYHASISTYHQGLALSALITDAQRLAAYIELLLEAEGRKHAGLSGLDAEIEGARGSLIIGTIATEFFSGRHERGNLYQVESVTACEIIIARPLAG